MKISGPDDVTVHFSVRRMITEAEQMKKCIYCGAELPDDAKACSNCGRPVPGMDAQDQGKNGENGTQTSSASDVSGNNGGNTDASGQAQGYWQFGQWHPLEDLDRQQSNPSAGGNFQSGNYAQGNNANGQNTGTENGSYGSNGQDNGWNGASGNNGQNNGWNGSSGNNGWDNRNPGYGNSNGYGQNGSGYGVGWNQGQDAAGGNGSSSSFGNYDGNYGGNPNSGSNGGNYGGYPNGGYPGGDYGYGNYPNRSDAQSCGLAVAAFIFGLLSIPFGEFFFIPCVLAIVMGIAALMQIRKNPMAYASRFKVFAIIGLVLGIILLVFWIIAYIAAARLMSDPAFMKELEQYMNTYINSDSGSSSFR